MSSNKNSGDKFLSGEEFEIWIKSRGITTYDAAEWLGITRQTLLYWRRNGISRAQALAISAIERGLQPWTPTDADRQQAIKREEPEE